MRFNEKKIFLITDSLGFNGWGEYTKSHSEILLRNSKINLFIFYKRKNTFDKNIKKTYNKRLKLVRLFNIHLIDLFLINIFSILYKPYIIHCMSEPVAKFAISIKNNAKIIQTIHGTYGDYFLSDYSKFLNFFDSIIFNSNFTKNYFELPIENFKQFVLFPFSTLLLNIEKNYNKIHYEKEKQLIFIGNSKERKGLNLILLMFDILKKEIKDLKLVIIGNLNSRHLKYINNKTGIYHYKNLTQTELIRFIQSSKVNLLPSKNIQIKNKLHFEGYGLVHVESIKLGTPSIGCVNTGNESIIINGINGYIIEQNNLDDLVIATRNLLNSGINNSFYNNVVETVKSINSTTYANEINKIYGIK